ncbi:MAG: peptidoglycan recognition family protein [Sediminicola sp.]
MKYCILLVCILLVSSCKMAHHIVDRPIVFDDQRTQLTLDYLRTRYGLEQREPTIVPRMIVLHWTVIPNLEASYRAFEKSTLPNWRPEIATVSGLNVSSQFLVDRDGSIYRIMPETTMARHVIGLNHCAIGIENVGGGRGQRLTRAQKKANIWLVRYLTSKYEIEYLVGHYEYTHFVGHPLWMESDSSYRTEKEDPGRSFLRKVKRATRDLDLNNEVL